MKIWEPKPPGTLWTTPGLLRDDDMNVRDASMAITMVRDDDIISTAVACEGSEGLQKRF